MGVSQVFKIVSTQSYTDMWKGEGPLGSNKTLKSARIVEPFDRFLKIQRAKHVNIKFTIFWTHCQAPTI